MSRKFWLFCVGVIIATIAYADTFNRFTPATGVLKGASNTYVTTAAVSTDIRSMWTGTCDSSTYLRGDGQCQAPPGTATGTVTSVALTAPSVFAVAGSPITTSGTLAVTFATGQTANQVLASPNGSPGAVSLRALVGADIPAINLAASGAGGVTGNLPVGNLNGGSGASSTTFWTGDATWSALDASDIATGTLAVGRGGTGTTTSTGTGSVVLSASPTFTGTVTVATLAATAATVGGSDVCREDGTDCPGGGGVSETSGSFSATFPVGCTTTPSLTYDWVKLGNVVTLMVVAQSGMGCTGDNAEFNTDTTVPLPSGLRPAATIINSIAPGSFTNNGSSVEGCMLLFTDGTIALGIRNSTTGACGINAWTSSGTRNGTVTGWTITYFVNNPS